MKTISKIYSLFIAFVSLLIKILPSKNSKVEFWKKYFKLFKFSQIPKRTERKRVWFHCASWGEFAKIRLLAEEVTSDFDVFVSFFSPSGILALEDIVRTKSENILDFQENNSKLTRINFFLLPPDTKQNSQKLISQISPSLLVWTESEIWLNYSSELKLRKIKQVVLCGKLRSKSLKLKPFLSHLFQRLYNQAEIIFTLDKNSALNFKELGVSESKISVLGDLKIEKLLDLKKQEIPKVWQKIKNEKKIFVLGSLHPSDWKLLKNAITQLCPSFYFLIVPHEPNDFSFLEQIVTDLSLANSQLLSKAKALPENLLLIDKIGFLQQLLFVADLAYIGGGFEVKGIHSILEAKIFQVPTFFGKNHQNSTEVLEEDKKFVVTTTEEFLEKINEFGKSKPNYTIPKNNFNEIKNIILQTIKRTS